MPNLKLYINESHYAHVRPVLSAFLPELRTNLCAWLEVVPEACQLAVLPVLALPDQPCINAELHLLPRASRTRERLERVGEQMRDTLVAVSGLSVAVRIAQLDSATYVALK